jgi:hypothetical protein
MIIEASIAVIYMALVFWGWNKQKNNVVPTNPFIFGCWLMAIMIIDFAEVYLIGKE